MMNIINTILALVAFLGIMHDSPDQESIARMVLIHAVGVAAALCLWAMNRRHFE